MMMATVYTFLVDPAEEARAAMVAALEPDTPWIGHDSLPQVAQSIDRGSIPAVVLVGPGIVHDDAMMLAESIQDERLPVKLIQFSKVLDPDRLRDALRSGVADVVEVGADPDEVRDAVARSRRDLLAQVEAHGALVANLHAPTPVVAVAAGKGGVGTSLVTTNLATALAGQGIEVGLVDLDVRSGDLAIMLQQRPSLTMLDALERVDHLDEDALPGYLTTIGERVRLLPAPLEGGDLQVPTGAFMRLLGLVGETVDVLVVDVGQVHDATKRAVLAEARHVVVVTTREVTAVRGTRRVLSELAAIGLPGDTVTLVAAQSDLSTGLSLADVGKALGHEVDVAVPFDKGAAKSVNQGDPLVNRRRSKAGQAIVGFAQRLADELQLLPDDDAQPR